MRVVVWSIQKKKCFWAILKSTMPTWIPWVALGNFRYYLYYRLFAGLRLLWGAVFIFLSFLWLLWEKMWILPSCGEIAGLTKQQNLRRMTMFKSLTSQGRWPDSCVLRKDRLMVMQKVSLYWWALWVTDCLWIRHGDIRLFNHQYRNACFRGVQRLFWPRLWFCEESLTSTWFRNRTIKFQDFLFQQLSF